VTLSANQAAGCNIGATVQLSADASGWTSPEYQFIALYQSASGAGERMVIHDYSTNASCAWIPTLATCYSLVVFVREQGEAIPCDLSDSIGYTVKDPNKTIALTTTPSTLPDNGSPVQLHATSTGWVHPEYKFVVQDGEDSIDFTSSYSATDTCSWTPQSVQGYKVTVYIREQGANVWFNSFAAITLGQGVFGDPAQRNVLNKNATSFSHTTTPSSTHSSTITNITANDPLQTYTVTPSSSINGTISPNTPQTVESGGSVTFTAVANTGYTVYRWLKDGSVVQTGGDSCTYANITADCTVSVTFILTPIITPSTPVNGTISPNTPQTVAYNSSLAFTASPSAGYAVNHWLVDGVIAQSGGLAFTLTNITANHTVSVTFIRTPTVTPSTPSHGSLSPNTAQTVSYGSSLTFTATPAQGYSVYQWIDNGVIQSGSTGSATYTLTNIIEDHSISVTFAADLTVTPSTPVNGAISPNSAQTVQYGHSLTFNATPNDGYEVYRWLVDGSIAQWGGRSFTLANIVANHTVSVTFAHTQVVTPSTPVNGTISPSTPQTVPYGSSLTFTATPNLGYKVDHWLKDGIIVQTTGTTYLLGNITAACTMAVTFALVPNTAPTINQIADQLVNVNCGEQTISLDGISVGNADDAWQTISINATSSNTALVPNPTVAYTSPNTTGALHFTPTTDHYGVTTITVVVQDNGGTNGGGADTTTRTFQITVNGKPIAATQSVTVTKDTAASITLTGNDPEFAPLEYTVTVNPAHGTLAGTAPDLTYTPVAGYLGDDSLVFLVNDGHVNSDPAVVSIRVGGKPVVDPQSLSLDQDSYVDVTLTGTDPQNLPLTYTVVTSPAHGQLIGITPDLTYLPDYLYSGTDAFTFQANNGYFDSDPQTVSLTINAFNYAPFAEDQTLATPPNTDLSIILTATDIEGNALTYDIVADPSHGTLSGAAPNLTYMPVESFQGLDSFTFTANDGTSDSNIAVVTIMVGDCPTAIDDYFTVIKNSRNNPPLNVLSNDSDSNDTPLSVTAVGVPGHGTAELHEGLVTYTPAPGYFGLDAFPYTIANPLGATATAQVYVMVSNDNGLVANDDTMVVPENSASTPIDVLKNDKCNRDAGGILLITELTPAGHGAASLADNAITYTPEPDYYGPDSFSYKVSDGIDGFVTANVAVMVAKTGNHAPGATDMSVTVQQGSMDTVVTVLDHVTDEDGDTLAITAISHAGNGEATLTDGQVTYTPQAGYWGSDSFTYTVSDGVGGTATASVLVTVTHVNIAPVANNDTVSLNIQVSGSVSVPVLVNDEDADGDLLTVTAVTQGADGSVVLNTDNTVTYTTTDQNFTSDTFTYTISDGDAISTATVTVSADRTTPALDPILVDPASPAPVESWVTVTANFPQEIDQEYKFRAGYQNDEHAWVWMDLCQYSTEKSVFWVPNTARTYTLALLKRAVGCTQSYCSEYLTAYTVQGASTPVQPACVVLTATPAGACPPNTPVTLAAIATGGLNVEYKFTMGYQNDSGWHWQDLQSYSTTATCVWQPTAGFSGNCTLVVMARECGQTTDYDAFASIASYTVQPSLTYVKFADGQVNEITEGTAVTLSVTSDGDANVQYKFAAGHHDGSNTWVWETISDSNASSCSWAPQYAQDYTITVTAYEAGATNKIQQVSSMSFTATPAVTGVTLQLNPTSPATINQSVSLTAIATYATGTNVEYQFSVDGTDLGGYSSKSSVSWMPSAAGTYQLAVAARMVGHTNPADASASQTVTISNNPPQATSQSMTTPEDKPKTITLSATDPDAGETFTYSVTAGNTAIGSITANGASVTYTPGQDKNGYDMFHFTATDSHGATSLGTVLIYVQPVNDPPSFTKGPDVVVAVNSGQYSSGWATATDIKPGPSTATDEASQTVHFIVSNDNNALFGTQPAISPNGTLTFLPAQNKHGKATVTVQLQDDGGTANGGIDTSDSQTFTITIDTAPIANPQSVTTPKGRPVSIALTGSDAEHDPLTYIKLTNTIHGTLTGSGSSYSYSPAANYAGPDSFTFKVNDGFLDSNSATVSITVNALPSVPVAVDQTVATPINTPLIITLDAYGGQGTLTASIVSQPMLGALIDTSQLNANGQHQVTYQASAIGTDSFTFKVNDGIVDSNIATVIINVSGPDYGAGHDPHANDLTLTVPKDAVIPTTLTGSDPDGHPLTYTIVSGPSVGGLSGAAPNVVYTGPGLSSPATADSFTFKVNNGLKDSNIATVTINFTDNATTGKPFAFGQTVSTMTDVAVIIALCGTDPANMPLTYSTASNVSHGILSGTGQYLTYKPDDLFEGQDSFTFRVYNGTQYSDVATVHITVSHAPVAKGTDSSFLEDLGADLHPLIHIKAADSHTDETLTYKILAFNIPPANDGDYLYDYYARQVGDRLINFYRTGGFTRLNNDLTKADVYVYFVPDANYRSPLIPCQITYVVYDGTTYSMPATICLTQTYGINMGGG